MPTQSKSPARRGLFTKLPTKLPKTLAMLKGQKSERRAEQFLKSRGLTLVERNYRCKLGEIDLIMIDGRTLVFVEVRYRRQQGYGSASESVDTRKQQKLIRAAQYYLQRLAGSEPACRFDVVGIGGNQTPQSEQNPIEWLPNAFTL